MMAMSPCTAELEITLSFGNEVSRIPGIIQLWDFRYCVISFTNHHPIIEIPIVAHLREGGIDI